MGKLGEELEKAGYSRIEHEAAAYAVNFIKAGGSRDAWIKAFDRAAASTRSADHAIGVRTDQLSAAGASHPTPGTGQKHIVHQDHASPAGARQPLPDAGLAVPVHTDQAGNAGAGNQITGGKAEIIVPNRASVALPPARDPTPGFINATIATNQAVARSVLYQVRTSDGRWWGNVKPYEISSMQRDSIRGMALLSACGALNNKQTRLRFVDLLSEDKAKIALDKAAKELAYVA